jgi:hypothetical protein
LHVFSYSALPLRIMRKSSRREITFVFNLGRLLCLSVISQAQRQAYDKKNSPAFDATIGVLNLLGRMPLACNLV